jgi:glutamyl-tRNA synthetase
MSVITRFAPSPTGYLHVGNVRTCLINWLYSRANGGKFILRIDDTDTERSKSEYVDAIKEDLEWLGLYWDETFFQSDRVEKYEDAKNRYIKSGRLYPCYESQEELEVKKKTLLSRNLPPIYDRAALNLTEEEKGKLTDPHYRFFIENKPIEWNDGIRGHLHFEAKNISDPILVRTSGLMTYAIASVVDDIDYGITHIIRGEDHISNSAVHIQMFEALSAKPPEFAHLASLKTKDGKISKRLGGFDIRSLREAGIQPIAVLSFLAKLGSSDPVEYRVSIEELISEFSLKKFGKAPANYDYVELERVNEKLIHHLPFEKAKAFFKNDRIDELFWNSVKLNLTKLNEVDVWWNICKESLKPQITDLDFTREVCALLPEGSWDNNTWNTWVEAIKAKTGRKGKDLFMPIRLALTGMDNGPELKNLLPILGRDKTVARLNGEIA